MTTRSSGIEPLLTTADVARILRCSADYVVHLYREGKIVGISLAPKEPPRGRPGKKMLRFREADIRAYIDAQAVVQVPGSGATAPSSRSSIDPGGESLLWGPRRPKARG